MQQVEVCSCLAYFWQINPKLRGYLIYTIRTTFKSLVFSVLDPLQSCHEFVIKYKAESKIIKLFKTKQKKTCSLTTNHVINKCLMIKISFPNRIQI